MARKLNKEEELEFVESLQAQADEAWSTQLEQKRDKPLTLAPELEKWLEIASNFGF
jgi:hypothetical protein